MAKTFVRAIMGGAFAGALLWLNPTPTVAQQTATVQGQVTESGTGRAIEGAEVFVSGRNSRAALTDALDSGPRVLR